MDLRPFIKNDCQLKRVKELVKRGLFNYQPFIFSEDLQTGVGFEFITDREGGGLVYWPSIPADLMKSPELRRLIIDIKDKKEYVEANQRLRNTYDGFVEAICERVPNVSRATFADIGCNSGYFPVSFSRRGALEAVGYDREDYSPCFDLLNEISGTSAKYRPFSYEGQGSHDGASQKFDVVISMMVLCHVSDILQHLSFLGSLAQEALFIWTLVTEDDDYRITFGEPHQYYKNSPFPRCFDYRVRPSVKLLKKSLDLLGFKNISIIPQREGGISDEFCDLRNIAIFASRK